MKIAQIAPLAESVPPPRYGGTERVVAYLCDELVELGHDVTLFASGRSKTRARLQACCPAPLRAGHNHPDSFAAYALMLEQVAQAAAHFDVLHFHIEWLHFPLFRRLDIASVTTLHGRLDHPELPPLLEEYSELSLISISEAQRRPVPWANWGATIHHGLPPNLLRRGEGGGHLLFLGRIAPEKGPDAAIRLALAAGLPLKIAAKVDAADRTYFAEVIEPMLVRPGIEFCGEVSDREKGELLGGARALLFPINWPEPFGLVMIEAMACGTPVIAYRCGAVPEIIEDGVTGYIVEDERAALAAIAKAERLDRRKIRREFERRFTSRRMADDYVRLYRSLTQPPVPRFEAV
jgi:glycosyltransferase involved in cell wall biosynthesis